MTVKVVEEKNKWEIIKELVEEFGSDLLLTFMGDMSGLIGEIVSLKMGMPYDLLDKIIDTKISIECMIEMYPHLQNIPEMRLVNTNNKKKKLPKLLEEDDIYEELIKLASKIINDIISRKDINNKDFYYFNCYIDDVISIKMWRGEVSQRVYIKLQGIDEVYL